MCLYYYAKVLRRLLKIKNKEKTSFTKKYLKENNLKIIKEKLIEFVQHYEKDNQLVFDLLDKIKKLYDLVVLKINSNLQFSKFYRISIPASIGFIKSVKRKK